MKTNKNVLLKVVSIDMLLLCFSINIAIVAQMFDTIKNSYDLSLSQGSMLLSAQSFGGLALAVICILFIDSFNKTKVLILAGLVLCSSLILVGFVPPLYILFVIFAILGFSGGAINTLTNSVMVDIVPAKAEKYINFMHMLFSLGAVLAPVLCQTVYLASGLQCVFYVFGGFALCWAIYSVFAFPDHMKQSLLIEKFSFHKQLLLVKSVFKTPGMKAVFVISIMISAWQLTAIYYISSVFSSTNNDAMDGALALSILFLGMMVSRLLYTKVADRYSKGRVLMLTNFLGILAWICVFIVPDITLKMVFVGLSALCCGNNFPITFSSACKLAMNNSATASGFVTLGYYIATFTFLPIIGAIGDTIGLQNTLVFCAVPLLIIIPVGYVLHQKMLGETDKQ